MAKTIQVTAATHFPIKLTTTNFPVWRRQVEAALIGLGLDSFITGEQQPPKQSIEGKEGSSINPEYLIWYRQDQTIISAILGCCSDQIQPLISSATTSKEAWERLNSSFASTSRSRVISLKSKLVKNPKGNRTIAEFLQDMRAIADDLALAQSPVTEEDLLVHVLSQLGEEYGTVVAAIKIRETPLTYSELFDKLSDFERALKEQSTAPAPVLTTVDYTHRQSNRSTGKSANYNQQRGSANRFSNQQRDSSNRTNWYSPSNSNGNRNSKSNTFCQYCNIPGHMTCDCRKLARFLRENNVTITNLQSSPVANVTMSGSAPVSSPWLFDSGASNHVTGDRSTLQHVSDYGGPDEIVLGNGNTLKISQVGSKNIHTSHTTLNLPNVLCVPQLKKNLISVAKLCKTNWVSVEFFSPLFYCEGSSHGGAAHAGGEL